MPLPPLPDFLRPKPPQRPPAGPGDQNQAVQAARTRARQRLVGALVLLVVGVITFPLLFETQPRPLAVDTPIRLAQRDGGTVRTQPAPAERAAVPDPGLPADAGVEAPATGAAEPATPASATAVVPPVAAPGAAPFAAPFAASVPASVADAGPSRRVTAASQSAAKPESKVEARPEPTPAPTPEPAPAKLPAPPAAQPAVATVAASAATGRFVVQVGAFSDPRTLREARQKVESLGLKTYTQVIDSGPGQRTRVRVGPFDSRTDAEAAARTIKGGGLPAVILAL